MVAYSMGDLFIEYGFCFRELEAKAATTDNNLQHEIVKKMSSNSVYYGLYRLT